MSEILRPGQVETAQLTLEQVACLASPARGEVFFHFSGLVPRSIAEIAEMVGRSASATTYHVAELVQVGLLVPAGERKKRSRTETLYVMSSRKGYLTEGASASPEYRKHVLAHRAAILRLVQREREAVEEAFAVDPSLEAFSNFRRYMVKLSPERADAVKKIVIEQLRSVAYGDPDLDGIMTTFTFTMSPSLAESRKIARMGKRPSTAAQKSKKNPEQ